jgi:hypothetical protein
MAQESESLELKFLRSVAGFILLDFNINTEIGDRNQRELV